MTIFKINPLHTGGMQFGKDQYLYNSFLKVFNDAGIKNEKKFSLDTEKLKILYSHLEENLKRRIIEKEIRDLDEKIWFQKRPITIFGQELILNGYHSEDELLDWLNSFYLKIEIEIKLNGIIYFEYV